MEAGKEDRAGHGGDRKSKVSEKPLIPTLTDIGIDKNLAHRARKAASLSPEKFEEHIQQEREQVTSRSAIDITPKGKGRT